MWAALAILSPARAAPKNHVLGLIRGDNVPVFSRPSTHAPILARLVEQTQVEVLNRTGDWSAILVWDSVRGWLRAAEIVYRAPWPSISTYHAPTLRIPVRASPLQRLHVSATILTSAKLYSSPAGRTMGVIPAGAQVAVTAWEQDRLGRVWYRLHGVWVRGDGVSLEIGDPARARSQGRPVWKKVSGKGMWLTLGTIASSDPNAIVRAALRDGLTHLYVESAISPWGFHGREAVGPLLDAAHQHHLTVVAWVFPYLVDVAADVDLTRQVAVYRTSTRQSFDGIAVDMERTMTVPAVRTYSQLVRASLGATYLLVAVTYPPRSMPSFPFGVVAHAYNVIAPMDYWHQTKTNFGLDYGHMRYGEAYTFRYASDSVADVRRVCGNMPVAPIGQTFDDFGRLEMGPYAPSGGEVQGFLAGSRARGAIGVSFFQWMTTQVGEWRAIAAFHY